jgi:hypothetical protein
MQEGRLGEAIATHRWTVRPRLPLAQGAAMALALVLTLAACGGSKVPSAGSTPNPSTGTGTPGATTGTSGGTATTSTAGSTSGTTGATGANGSTSTAPRPSASGSGGSFFVLDRACARRGVDRQGLTGQTQPHKPYGYETFYSDGNPYFGPDPSESPPGNGGSTDSGPDGRFRATWVVPAAAPVGDAVVRVNTVEGLHDLPFKVVAQTEQCP